MGRWDGRGKCPPESRAKQQRYGTAEHSPTSGYPYRPSRRTSASGRVQKRLQSPGLLRITGTLRTAGGPDRLRKKGSLRTAGQTTKKRQRPAATAIDGSAAATVPQSNLSRQQRIREQHRHGQRADSAGNRRDPASDPPDTLEVDVTHEPALASLRIHHPIDAHINHSCSRLHHLRGDQLRPPNGCHQDVCRAGDLVEARRS